MRLLARFWFLPIAALGGCQMEVLNPQGPIGVREATLIALTFGIMMIVVVPVIFLTVFFAWRYRAGGRAPYTPEWSSSWKIELTVWGVPFLIVLFLGILSWRSTHALDPYRKLSTTARQVNVDVVALNWKWLFIYPDQHIATINRLVIPTGAEVNFHITSDTVMNVFFIPQLGTQIYAMSGMQTQLHLMAKNRGTYAGISANFSGSGFADMRFATNAVSETAFNAWVKQTQAAPNMLSDSMFFNLEKPSTNNRVTYYGDVAPGLFTQIVNTGGMTMAAGKKE